MEKESAKVGLWRYHGWGSEGVRGSLIGGRVSRIEIRNLIEMIRIIEIQQMKCQNQKTEIIPPPPKESPPINQINSSLRSPCYTMGKIPSAMEKNSEK